jgi:4'-phosphopantetheinyl transferase
VHVWRVALDLPLPDVERLTARLSADERARASRFVFDRDRGRFTVARAALRTILARYLDRPANALVFDYTSHGKPFLRSEADSPDIRFNVSHAAGVALIAVALAREVGVDVEDVREGFAAGAIAERFFSPAEVDALQALPAADRTAGFFNCWTRKEAYVKARGEGLSLPLSVFDVSLTPGEPAALLAVRGNPLERTRWSLQALSLEPGYAAALAVEGTGWRSCCWEWGAG